MGCDRRDRNKDPRMRTAIRHQRGPAEVIGSNRREIREIYEELLNYGEEVCHPYRVRPGDNGPAC